MNVSQEGEKLNNFLNVRLFAKIVNTIIFYVSKDGNTLFNYFLGYNVLLKFFKLMKIFNFQMA